MTTESRSEATARVTAGVASWLWGQGARALVPEVGLHPTRGLCAPWDGRWRVDLVSATPRHGARERIDVIEVKGTVADLRRESLTDGKWVMRLDRIGLTPWLAVSSDIGRDYWRELPPMWGVVSCHGHDAKVMRQPEAPIWHDIVDSNDDVTAALRAMAVVSTSHALPMLMGLGGARRAAAMETSVTRPWTLWRPPSTIAGTRVVEEPGNIL